MIGSLILAVAMTTGVELIKTSREVRQDKGTWVVSYKLRSPFGEEAFVRRSDVVMTLAGTASNSAVPGDGVCREFRIIASDAEKSPGNFGRHAIHLDESDARSCRMAIRVEMGDKDAAVISPGRDLDLRIFFEHNHFVYGIWEPILGNWSLGVDMGEFQFRDRLKLDMAERARPDLAINVGEGSRDETYSKSAVNSVYFASHDPCKNNVSVNNIPVRYGTKLRFSFRYLVAVGTEGEPCVELRQETDVGNMWKRIYDADMTIVLTTVGKWHEYSGIINVDGSGSLLDVRFRLASSDVGEVWISDLQLKEVGFSASGNP